jgi:uncharacterized protein (TIGR03435 family)
MRALPYLSFIALLSAAAFGQSEAAAPAFEIADVHVSPKAMRPQLAGPFLRNGRYELRQATMVDLVSTAYGVGADKVQGGPNWLEADRFDVIAKAAGTTPPETVKLMLQGLLADRFKLVVHTDSKPLSVFVLSMGKGKPKMKEADSATPPGCQGVPQNPQPGAPSYQVVACHGFTMPALADLLPRMANAYVTSNVVDSTGLKGAWDFELKWTGRGQLAAQGADGISLFDAVDKQLGLKLEPQKIPQSVVVVDSVNQKPTANPPGVSTSLPPPPPAEFEVAEIKPSRPDEGQMVMMQNNRLDLKGLTLKDLIMAAWSIDDNPDFLSGPKFMDSVHYDVLAKVNTNGPANAPQIDEADLRLMLKALLIERFKMVTHSEDRPVSGYVLSSVKPKMQKADPSSRSGCKNGPGPDGKDPRIANPVLNRLIYCQNTTMAQLAEALPTMVNGYVHTGVLDSTGIEGGWDFTLSFSGINLVQGNGRGADSGANADPNGALSLPDAVSKQLGLKLELQKRPMPVLVIDRMEEKPTDN